jgi:hypothetical protein
VSVIPKRYPEFHGILKNCQQHIQRIDDKLGKLKTADAGKIAAKIPDLVEQITRLQVHFKNLKEMVGFLNQATTYLAIPMPTLPPEASRNSRLGKATRLHFEKGSVEKTPQ